LISQHGVIAKVKEGLAKNNLVVYKLKEGKAILEEKVTPSMEIYLNMGLNIVKITGSWVGRIIYNLYRRVKSEGFLVEFTGTLDDDNVVLCYILSTTSPCS